MVAAAGAGTAAGLKSAGAMQMGSGATGILSGLASLQAASIQAKQFKLQGVFLDLQANQEKLKARENAVFLRKKFLSNIASANASFAARGVSISSGVGRQFQIESLETLGQDIKAAELSSEAAQISLGLRSTQTRLAGKTARATGLLKFAGTGSKSVGSLLTGYKTFQAGKALEANQGGVNNV